MRDGFLAFPLLTAAVAEHAAGVNMSALTDRRLTSARASRADSSSPPAPSRAGSLRPGTYAQFIAGRRNTRAAHSALVPRQPTATIPARPNRKRCPHERRKQEDQT